MILINHNSEQEETLFIYFVTSISNTFNKFKFYEYYFIPIYYVLNIC